MQSLYQLLALISTLSLIKWTRVNIFLKPQIYKLFADLCDASQQIIQAELISAKPVSVVFLERLEKNISAALSS